MEVPSSQNLESSQVKNEEEHQSTFTTELLDSVVNVLSMKFSVAKEVRYKVVSKSWKEGNFSVELQ